MTTSANSSSIVSSSSTTPPSGSSKSGSMKRSPQPMSITKELEESMTHQLAANGQPKATFRALLKLELKGGEKLENRLLAFTTYRLFVFTVSSGKGVVGKLEHSFSYLDVSSLESRTPNRLVMGFQAERLHMAFQAHQIPENTSNSSSSTGGSPEEVITLIISHLVTTLKTLFPHTPLEAFIRRLDLEPRARLEPLIEYVQAVEEKARLRLLDGAPCGGFSNQYACFCDYHGVAFREEVAWDIDTIYAAHGNTELSLLDFEHLDLRELVPIVAALAYNGWFTRFRVSNVKIAGGHHSSGSSSGSSTSSSGIGSSSSSSSSSNSSGSEQLCEAIIVLVRRSVTLEELYLDNTGIKADLVNRLFSALLLNNQTAIRAIDLSNNALEDKGLKSMTAFVAKSFHMANSAAATATVNFGSSNLNASTDDLSSSLSLNFSVASSSTVGHMSSSISNSNQNTITSTTSGNGGPQISSATSSAKLMYRGLVHLNLAHTGITSKGICELAESLYLNKSMFTTLTYLNLSDNSFKDDLTKLYNFLAQPNNLTHLDLSGTDCNLESVFGALLHGCTNNLVHLNLSRNQFSGGSKKGGKSSHHSDKDLVVPAAIKKFFSTAIFLRTLNLSSNRLPSEALKAVLLGLACNESATDIRINLSSNEFKANGAAVLELALTDIRCVSGLDLSDNALDMELPGVVGAIARNKALKYLSIGRNFGGIKAKHLPKVLDAFVLLLQDPDCSLESLSLVDSKLRAETSIVLNALGSNHSLINVDVSGNMMGLTGAKTLAKALQVNTRLETIYLDRNFIPTAGFIDLAYALERNYTLRYLPVPVQDVQAAMLKMAERTEAAVTKIQEYIRRNNLPQTAIVRSLRQHSLGHSSAAYFIDGSLFGQLERNSFQLAQVLRSSKPQMNNSSTSNHSFDPSAAVTSSSINRIPSIDSIDINLNNGGSDQENTIIVDECFDDYSRAECLLRESAHAKTLASKLQEVYSSQVPGAGLLNGYHHHHSSSGVYSTDSFTRRFSTTATAASVRPIEANLIEFAKELRRTFESQAAAVCELMIQLLREECPQLFATTTTTTSGRRPSLEAELKELYTSLLKSGGGANVSMTKPRSSSSVSAASSSSSSLMPSLDYFHLCLTESTACTTWTVKLEAVLHSVATQMVNRVLLEMNRGLTSMTKVLSGAGGQRPLDSRSLDFGGGGLGVHGHGHPHHPNHHPNHHQHSNGHGLHSVRSLTPDVLRSRPWNDSASSQDSTENGGNLDSESATLGGPMLDVDGGNAMWLAWLNLATPKLQNGTAQNHSRRQNVYIRKLRPQSVLDGATMNSEESGGGHFADFRVAATTSTDSSPLGFESTSTSAVSKTQQHLTKSRPRVRKTRAPTRVTLVSSSSNEPGSKGHFEVNNNNHSSPLSELGSSSATAKLDEGLDSFFPTIRVSLSSAAAANSASANSLDIKEVISLPTIKESPSGVQPSSVQIISSAAAPPPPLSARPQPQPRKQTTPLLRKFGFNKSTEQPPPPSEQQPVFSVKSISVEQPPNPPTSTSSSSSSSHITLKNDDFIRAPSPTFFSAKRSDQHVSICSDGPENGGRGGGSPVPVGDNSHNEFLAEMRAKQEKRSHGSTPLNETGPTFAGTLAEMKQQRSSPEQSLEGKTTTSEPNNNHHHTHHNSNGNGSGSNSSTASIAKRATIFGELHKSPSKASITQAFGSGGGSGSTSSSGEESTYVPSAAPSSFTASSVSSSVNSSSSSSKQRPKSMVGMLGAKFELSLMNAGSNK